MKFADYVTKPSPKIIGIAMNYLKHIMQLGQDNYPENPMLFLKPWTSLSYMPSKLSLPQSKIRRIDHQIEFGVFIDKPGKNIPKHEAMQHVGGYFIAIDFTDKVFLGLQSGYAVPWLIAKGQDGFCPISDLISKQIDPHQVDLELKVNNLVQQKGSTKDMHFKINEIISYISQIMTLQDGDLILTGTPPGVNRIKIGDQVQCNAIFEGKNMGQLKFEVTQ